MQTPTEAEKRRQNVSTKRWILSSLLFAGVVGLCVGYAAVIWPGWSTLRRSGEAAGQFGDAFGGLNTLFSSLAFAGLIITIFLQRQQLIDQRDEITIGRKRQNSEWSEAKFFRLLDIYQAALAALKTKRDGRTYDGIDALNRMAVALDEHMRAEGLSASEGIPKKLRKAGVRIDAGSVHLALRFAHYRAIYLNMHRHARYVESFKLLLRHVEAVGVDPEERQFYLDVVRAQLTYIELRYLFYIALGHSNEGEFRTLLQSTGLIELAKLSGVHTPHRDLYTRQWGYTFRSGDAMSPMPMSKEDRRKGRALYNDIAPYFRSKSGANGRHRIPVDAEDAELSEKEA
ncbi:hypothetical protein P3T18_003115 [Paraburkholderia sp. GAS199]|uniref:hypothetical protein n=1 Tax=Paraburkholderia sp. GAS199 TaxID=3035126 RepID=UPI003D1C4455